MLESIKSAVQKLYCKLAQQEKDISYEELLEIKHFTLLNGMQFYIYENKDWCEFVVEEYQELATKTQTLDKIKGYLGQPQFYDDYFEYVWCLADDICISFGYENQDYSEINPSISIFSKSKLNANALNYTTFEKVQKSFENAINKHRISKYFENFSYNNKNGFFATFKMTNKHEIILLNYAKEKVTCKLTIFKKDGIFLNFDKDINKTVSINGEEKLEKEIDALLTELGL